MRRLQCLACLILLVLGSCTERKATPNVASMEQTDSLQRIIAQRDNEINDMMGTLNEIQEGLREINEAENRLSVAKNGEGSSRSVQIKENIRFIANTMAHNRELIKKLQQQLRESRFGGDELRKTIESLTQQLDEKEQQLQKLRAELDSKDIHIAQLDEKISNLNTNVENLKIETQEKSQTIGNQDKQLNTAWFVFGTKKELKEQHILVDGKVLQSNFNKSYFTKIDRQGNQALFQVGARAHHASVEQLHTCQRCQQPVCAAHQQPADILVHQQVSRHFSEMMPIG